jgi:hypothetical protein
MMNTVSKTELIELDGFVASLIAAILTIADTPRRRRSDEDIAELQKVARTRIRPLLERQKMK